MKDHSNLLEKIVLLAQSEGDESKISQACRLFLIWDNHFGTQPSPNTTSPRIASQVCIYVCINRLLLASPLLTADCLRTPGFMRDNCRPWMRATTSRRDLTINNTINWPGSNGSYCTIVGTTNKLAYYIHAQATK